MSKILIVEDEPAMLQGLKDNLEFESYLVDTAAEGQAGLDKILQNSYDLVLLDVMLPHLSGFDVCKAARSKGVQTPIILLTAKGEDIDKVLGLELGADDYITKPFNLRELLARIKAILRRTSANKELLTDKLIAIGNLSVNFDSYTGFVDNREVRMSHKEFEVLHYLYNNKSKTISRDDIMEKVWGIDSDITTRTIDNFILRLRQKIEAKTDTPKIIITVHGVGYKMVL